MKNPSDFASSEGLGRLGHQLFPGWGDSAGRLPVSSLYDSSAALKENAGPDVPIAHAPGEPTVPMSKIAPAEAKAIPGWFHHGAKILELIEQHRPRVCVELGTWQGASAVPVARSIQRWGGTLTCIDTWSGELNEDGGSLGGKAPVMLLSCARALVEAGVSANVRLIPALTLDAVKVWDQPIDYLYIDADHSYGGVLGDLIAWYPHVKPGGLIIGDDYGNAIYPGVKEAWDKFERMRNLSLCRYQSDPPAAQGVQLIYGMKQFHGMKP